MKNAFWNYTEPVTYRHVLVRVYKKVNEPVLSWQNAFVGQEIEALEITYEPETINLDPMPEAIERHIFYIDNQDGLGILKIQRGGGPDSGSRHFNMNATEVIRELNDNEATHKFNRAKYHEVEAKIEQYQQQADPEAYKRLQGLKDSIRKMQGDNRKRLHGNK